MNSAKRRCAANERSLERVADRQARVGMRAWSPAHLAGVALGLGLILAGTACSSSSSASTPLRGSASSAPTVNSIGAGSLPAQTSATVAAFPAYYDAHKDIVVVTDAYPKPAAAQLHANYAPSLGAVAPASQPLWFLIHGSAATGQITVLGSQPGESDYSPLWRTVVVTWKPGSTPVLLTSDNQINHLAAKGQLTETTTSQIVNAAVIAVGK